MADLVITAASVADVTGSENYLIDKAHRAGATITAGQAVCLDGADTWQLADANGAAGIRQTTGIALHAASAGQFLAVQLKGDIAIGATVTVGEIYVLSNTPGGIAPRADLASGWYTNVIGIGKTTAQIKLIFGYAGVSL